MDQKTSPIGFFDSGIGGLSVLRLARKELPCENFIFFGDNKNVPYGEKTPEEILRLTMACCDQLFQKGCKLILVACNTATSAAINDMRDRYQIPVVSMEPAVKPAYAASKGGKILVMATPSAIKSARYARLVERVGCKEQLINILCHGLADMLETGDFENKRYDEYLYNLFNPHGKEEVESVVVGCTHYSFITEKIKKCAREVFGHECAIYDGMYGTVQHMKDILEKSDGLNPCHGKGQVEIITTGGDEAARRIKNILEA